MANRTTFPVALGGDGNTYSDDAHPETGLDNLGYLERLVPLMGQGVAMATSARDSAAAADASNAASKKSADASAKSAQASQKALQDSAQLYDGLQAVDAARTAAQKAASVASQQSGQAQTARKGAEDAQGAAETAASQSQQAASQAVTEHMSQNNPHTQYALKEHLGAASERGVVGGSGDLMAKGYGGIGSAEQISALSQLSPGGSMNAIDSSNTDPQIPSVARYGNMLAMMRNNDIRALFIVNEGDEPRAYIRTTRGGEWGPKERALYSQPNILTPVSFDGNIPDGGIIERGETSSGIYVKYADGSMVLRGSVTLTHNSSSYLTANFVFPRQFRNTKIHGSVCYNQMPNLDAGKLGVSSPYLRKNNITADSTRMEVGFICAGAFSSGDTAGADVTLWGEWK